MQRLNIARTVNEILIHPRVVSIVNQFLGSVGDIRALGGAARALEAFRGNGTANNSGSGSQHAAGSVGGDGYSWADRPLLDGGTTFRSLKALQTIHFQAYGVGVWDAFLKGVNEANGEVPPHEQTLRACACRILVENFEAEYFTSQQYAVNDGYCEYAKAAFDRVAEDCKRARDVFWESDFSTSGGRVGYDVVLLAHVTELNFKEQRAREQYDDLVVAMNYGLITKFK
jgi:hypothetical protein